MNSASESDTEVGKFGQACEEVEVQFSKNNLEDGTLGKGEASNILREWRNVIPILGHVEGWCGAWIGGDEWVLGDKWEDPHMG